MKKCPRCKKEFTRDLQFCSVCGYRDENSIVANEFYICPQCKIEYSYKIDHCSHCGYSTNKYKEKIKYLQNGNELIRQQNIPKCPTCQSTNIRRISGTKKAASIIGFGILSSSLGKTYECLNCKYKW